MAVATGWSFDKVKNHDFESRVVNSIKLVRDTDRSQGRNARLNKDVELEGKGCHEWVLLHDDLQLDGVGADILCVASL